MLVEEARVLSVVVDVGVGLLGKGKGVPVAGTSHDHVALERRPVGEDSLGLVTRASTKYGTPAWAREAGPHTRHVTLGINKK